MKSLKELLENHFIYKEADRGLYYSIYDGHDKYRSFLEKLGYRLIIRHDFIRLEKFPAEIDEHMGIEDFTTVEEYMLFMILLMFLEDKTKEDQFLLKDIVEYMEGNTAFEVDTTVQRTRRQICHVLKFAKENNLLTVCGGNIDKYVTDAQTQVLYDNTGLSKYFMRSFPTGLNNCENYNDLVEFIHSGTDKDKKSARRRNVYRNLLLRPVVYNHIKSRDEYEYIKQYRSLVEEDFEKHLGWSLHLQRELAMVVPDASDRIKDSFPNAEGISGAMLLFSLEIRKRLDKNQLNVNKSGNIHLSKEEFNELAAHVKSTRGIGFTQTLRNMTPERFANELLTQLIRYMMCEVNTDDVILLPAIAKIVGDYPADYISKMGLTNE